MASGQVSVWIPLLVAILGIVGVVVGQIVNAWREDRRWKMEAQRDEWRHWRDKRLEVYTNFYSAAELLVRKLSMRSANYWVERTEHVQAEVDSFLSTVGDLAYSAALVGSTKVGDLCIDLFYEISDSDRREVIDVESIGEQLVDLYREMRTDLGLQSIFSRAMEDTTKNAVENQHPNKWENRT